MNMDRVDRTVVTEETPVAPVTPGEEPLRTSATQQTVRTDSRRVTRSGPGAPETTRRIVVLVFGLIQLLIGARFVLLLVAARTANDLVSGILNFSQLFVGPFEGILRTDSLNAGHSVLDFAAIVAFVGWTIIELIVIWALGIFRREPA